MSGSPYAVGRDVRPRRDKVRPDRWYHIALAWALCIAVGAMMGAMI